MNVKKIFIIICIVLFLGVFGVIFFTMINFDIGSDRVVKEGEDNVTTELGDEFIIAYVTTNFPDYQTEVDVLDKRTKRIGDYNLEGDYEKPNITVIINSKNIRCYQVSQSLLIYKSNDGEFKGIKRSQIDNKYITKDKDELLELSKELTENREWKWIEFFGKFLIEENDSDMKKTLERYSNGQFTQEELDLNKNSNIKKEEMQSLAKRILEKK